MDKQLVKSVNEKIYGLYEKCLTDHDLAKIIDSTRKEICWDFFIVYEFNKKNYTFPYDYKKDSYNGLNDYEAIALSLWHNRFLKNYQSDIEETVKNAISVDQKNLSNLEFAWQTAEKVKLFDAIIMLKKDKNWLALEKGYEQPHLIKTSKNRRLDLLDLIPIAKGSDFAEVVLKACLYIKEKQNEQQLQNHEQCSKLVEEVDS